MPSPFPGMDPWLEHPALFPDLHDRLIAFLSDTLNGLLPAPYYSGITSRVWVDTTRRAIEPDVNVLAPPATGPGQAAVGGGGVAGATLTEPVVIHVPHDETRESFLEIYTQAGDERLVTTIEILSLKNKRPGEQGRDLYLKKQKEVLGSQVHLVEIDLLRGGTHTTAVPRDLVEKKVGPFDYHVSVHRFNNLEDYFVYPWQMGARLPSIEIPLLPADPAVRVDLQPLLDRCYDGGHYDRRARYRDRTPVPPLSAEQMAWADRLLAQRGL